MGDDLRSKLPDELVDELLAGAGSEEEIVGPGGLLSQLTKRLVERAMEVELTDHLGYEPHQEPPGGAGNTRNGSTSKTLSTEHGPVEVRTPRDRDGSFAPKIVRKRQRRFEGFDEKILALYSRGLSVRDVQAHLREIYGGYYTLAHKGPATAVTIGVLRRPIADLFFDAEEDFVTEQQSSALAAVYVQTNDAAENEVLAFQRRPDGGLASLGRFATGGRGTGKPHLPSQSSVVLGDDGRRLLVVNAGSDELSLFAVEKDGLRLTDRVASGGATPTSVAIRRNLVYVLNNGTPNIAGLVTEDGQLVELEGSARRLSAEDADPAQVAFSPDGRTLAVTERGTNSISTFAVDTQGLATGPTTIRSSGQTPYGFAFTEDGAMIVTEAFGGAIGAASASSYSITDPGMLAPVSGSVGDTRSEVCWAAVSDDGRFAYVTNFGDGTISSYEIARDGGLRLRDAVAGSTRSGDKGIRDEAITRDGSYLYAIDADAQQLLGWSIQSDGALVSIGAFDGVPPTVAGLATS